MKNITSNNLFAPLYENQAIERIQKFAKIAKAMEFDICLGFSGGKDSQVTYDLCLRSGVDFKAYFNHSFESAITLKFVKENYPNVIKRRDHKYGFIENITRNHSDLFPNQTSPFRFAMIALTLAILAIEKMKRKKNV